MNPNLPPARRRHFLTLTADWERKGELVPVLLRITAEPESACERFNALAPYALRHSIYLRYMRSTDNARQTNLQQKTNFLEKQGTLSETNY